MRGTAAIIAGRCTLLAGPGDRLSPGLVVLSLTLAALLGMFATWTEPRLTVEPSSASTPGYVDVRSALYASVPPTNSQRAAMERLPGVRVRWDERYGVPAVVTRYGGFLSGPGTDARAFLRTNAALFGLTERGIDDLVRVQEYVSPHNGARHVAFRQLDSGRIVHGSLIKVTLDRAGRVVFVGGSSFRDVVARPGARLRAVRGLLARDSAGAVARRATGGELVTFPMPGGRPALLGYRKVELTASGWAEAIVDADSGELLYRSLHSAAGGPQGTVFTTQNPTLGPRQTVSFAGGPFNSAGWVSDRTTAGNNVSVYDDADGDDTPDYQPQTPPAGDPAYQHFDFTFADAFRNLGTDIVTDRDAAVTQAFYYINFLHDYFYGLGFDEPAGNFQDDNFGRGGIGNDAMIVEVHNGFSIGTPKHSNTQTPPGQRPKMELNAYAGTRANGALDGDLIAHEYTHGVSNRLVMTEAVGGGLPEGIQTWALGEGWSDFFGTSIYDDPVAGDYVCGNTVKGCPQYAYDQSPLVYSDLCTMGGGGCEPHRDGEILTAALWDLRATLGRAKTEQLVIDGMKNTIPAATFLDARDGILAADMLTSGGANQCAIWQAFAGREMGLSAATSADQKVVTAATDIPGGCLPTASAAGPYTTAEGVQLALSAVGSASGSEASAGPITAYDWDLDGDGEFDDASGISPMFTAVGADGTFPVALRVTSSTGITDTAATIVTVTNAAPDVVLAAFAATVEGSAVTLSGKATDGGWLDVLTATVDWNDGNGAQPLAGTMEHQQPGATLSFSSQHVYGDNGSFQVHVCVSDDDTTTCGNVTAPVENVNPTAAIATSGQIGYGGKSVYITHAGGSISVAAASVDPGSDDLTLTWDWDSGVDTTVLSLVNPPNPDPVKSPSVQPRELSMSRSHTYGSACLYNLKFRSQDDDGGAAEAQASVIIVGNATVMRGSGWWMSQYRPGPPNGFSAQTLACYLDIVAELSLVFDPPLGREKAVEILFVNQNKGSARQLLDSQLLAAWLNFAHGAIALADVVDTNGDGVNDTTFGAALLAAETARTSPGATDQQLLAHKDIIERIVLRDE